MFSPDEVKLIAQKALTIDFDIPDDHKGAVVLVADLKKVQVVSAIRVNDNWKVLTVVEHEWTGANNVGVISKLTW